MHTLHNTATKRIKALLLALVLLVSSIATTVMAASSLDPDGNATIKLTYGNDGYSSGNPDANRYMLVFYGDGKLMYCTESDKCMRKTFPKTEPGKRVPGTKQQYLYLLY